ncbi:unnamed protein product [Peronospora belbahrii]|uniref:Microcephalin n=1 Tax=Peronospora belbahrii TaxID=622444 RepID=A0AAU9LD46_9STRA|nr:unnamed protein product [Peronospora belbahrii]
MTRKLLTRVSPQNAAPIPSTTSSTVTASQRRRPRSTGPLKGIVAMVDVRVGTDAQIDCSDVVARKLRELGASTVKRFTPKLTHVILSHFTPIWKTKITKWQAGGGSMTAVAMRYDLKIVSQLWVNACYVSKKRMDERPFFPVSQHNIVENFVVKANSKLQRRQSLGTEICNTIAEEQTLNQSTGYNAEVDNIPAPSTPPPSTFKIVNALTSSRKKRRALSMEPMTSDAILKMLGTTESISCVAEITTPKQPVRFGNVSSSAKRRKTLNGPPLQQDEDEATVSQASEIIAESEPENEKEDEVKEKANDMTVVLQDSQATQPLLSLSKEDKMPIVVKGLNTTSTMSSEEIGTSGINASKKEPTARELRRRNRNSLSYGSGLTLKSGIWSCVACGCSNPRTRRYCTDCQALKGSAKSSGADTIHCASSAASTRAMADSPEIPSVSPAAVLTPVARETTTTTPEKKARTSSFANRLKTPVSSPSMFERTSQSLTRATASSSAKARATSPAASRVSRPAAKTLTPSPVIRLETQNYASRSSASKQAARSSLASASVSADVQEQKFSLKKAQERLPTVQLAQSAAKKRACPPVFNNTLTTPVVKKARRESNKENFADKYMATPGSVSGFVRKNRDVNSTPIPMAMNFSTISKKTPRKTQRNIIGITGVSAETRGVLQCAIHAIDANMSNASGHRKARVVKSVDYTAGVTHLVVGKDARRTIKVLFAIARGAWIVSEDWAFSSLEQERWLPEEDYEVTMFANKYAREHPEYRQIFKNMKVYIGPNVDPSREVLQSLVQVAGGEICNQVSVADICICGDASLFRRAQRTGIRVVTSKWVFDSIAAMKLENDALYTFAETLDTPAKIPIKSGQTAVSGLEAHSTVLE